jgi:hypothetical protein
LVALRQRSQSRLCILQIEALYDLLEICRLVKINLAVFAPYAHVQELLGIAQISAFPSLHKELLSFKEFLLVCTQEENIIYIDDNNNTLVFINKESRV